MEAEELFVIALERANELLQERVAMLEETLDHQMRLCFQYRHHIESLERYIEEVNRQRDTRDRYDTRRDRYDDIYQPLTTKNPPF